MSTNALSMTMAEAKASGSRKGMSVAARLREQAALDATISADPKYKKYSQQVEKCLATFENMHEWPDFIAFLKQLLKTLQSYPQFKEIPRKLTVAKRLSQCLIPALPSGVHQRALDVYTHILSVLGPEGLRKDLHLWSSGLFPFFDYASTSVKPTLLNIFELYFLPLQEYLRPIMRSFILALLPGLEEETGEYFERSLGLLDRLSGTVTPAFFLQNIWLVMLTTQVSRAYALTYLSRRLPRIDTGEDITPIVGRDVGLMIRAFAAVLSDDNLLVQRGALDLLVQTLRIESAAVTRASPADRAILMRAATGVVLRRDLSLNRRLFTWLLGKDENGDAQIAYFQQHGLHVLVESLKEEMFSPSSEYASTRPFKIFISLLDKWEIGSPLSEALIYDALKAIKRRLAEGSASGEDILITANTLYEAVEPRAVWKALFAAVRSEVNSDGDDNDEGAINMLLFVLNTFRIHEEEVLKIHLPLVFAAFVEMLEGVVRMSPTTATTSKLHSIMTLLEQIILFIPPEAMSVALQLADVPPTSTYEDIALHFYGLKSDKESTMGDDAGEITKLRDVVAKKTLFADCFALLQDVSLAFLAKLPAREVGRHRDRQEAWKTFCECCAVLLDLLNLFEPGSEKTPVALFDTLNDWFDELLGALTNMGCTFLVIDNIVSLAISLHSLQSLQPPFRLKERPRLQVMTNALLRYLRPESTPYHLRAVNLIWKLESATGIGQVEAIISQSITDPSPEDRRKALAAFGVLWRLSEDAQRPGIHFKIPMLVVLDMLKDDDPIVRQTGETWMRCNLRAYPRILDPIFLELLDPSIKYHAHSISIQGRELTGLVYTQTFDQRRIAYLLEILLHVVQFGGQSFNRITASSIVGRSYAQQLAERVAQTGLGHADSSYLEVAVGLLLRFMQAEPKPSLVLHMQSCNTITQATAIDILQEIVARGELDEVTVETLEAAVTSKLFMLVHTSRLDVQNKLLHLLHSVISATTALADRRRARQAIAMPEGTSNANLSYEQDSTQAEALFSSPVNPLLIQLLVDGICVPSNRGLLHHWLDFVLLTAPQFPHIMSAAVTPLTTCVCRQLRNALADVRDVVAASESLEADILSRVDDAELVMLLNALERLVLLCLDEADPGSSEDGTSPTDKSASDGAGLFSMVSNVFLADSQSQHVHNSHMTARSPSYRSLHEGVGILFRTWMLVSEAPNKRNPAIDTISHMFIRAGGRCRKVLERFFRVHAFEVIESMVDYWNRDQETSAKNDGAFEVIDFLTASAQNVVHMICESISCRINTSHERSRKQVLNPDLTDTVLFAFLEGYLAKLETPLAVQVWSRYLSLAKDITSSIRDYRAQAFPVLRCLSVLAYKITQTTAVEDRRFRRDLQDVFGKLLDSVMANSSRTNDQIAWIRRTNRDAAIPNGRETPISRVASESKLDEKLASATGSAPVNGQSSSAYDVTEQIYQFLVTDALPNLRRYLMDNDKVATACSNVVYYIVSPALKSKASRTLEIEDTIVRIIEQLSRIPAAFKSWRTTAMEVFSDNRFFSMTPDGGFKWRTIITSIVDTDRSALTELLGKIAAAPSANIFANREYEMLTRSLNLRRLSYVLLASEKNHFLTQLPAIQEKLVDILRSGNAPIVECEAYLCIRVLLCRLSPHNLSSFWPVLLTELIRIFEQVMGDTPSDGSENLQTLLSACKLLDLLLVLQTDEFQIHQWIFITDTVDAVYRPDNWFPEAVMDQLAEIVSDLPVSEAKRPVPLALPELSSSSRSLRQPLLSGVRQIDSMHDLATFFSHISIMSYEGVYASGGSVDWQAVERSLLVDMFDGR